MVPLEEECQLLTANVCGLTSPGCWSSGGIGIVVVICDSAGFEAPHQVIYNGRDSARLEAEAFAAEKKNP